MEDVCENALEMVKANSTWNRGYRCIDGRASCADGIYLMRGTAESNMMRIAVIDKNAVRRQNCLS